MNHKAAVQHFPCSMQMACMTSCAVCRRLPIHRRLQHVCNAVPEDDLGEGASHILCWLWSRVSSCFLWFNSTTGWVCLHMCNCNCNFHACADLSDIMKQDLERFAAKQQQQQQQQAGISHASEQVTPTQAISTHNNLHDLLHDSRHAQAANFVSHAP